MVDPGGGADEPVVGLGDDETAAGADDPHGLAQNHLELADVGLRACELAGSLGGLDLVERDHPALCLRDCLLRDDDDVPGLE